MLKWYILCLTCYHYKYFFNTETKRKQKIKVRVISTGVGNNITPVQS